jgi:hypothetical protein
MMTNTNLSGVQLAAALAEQVYRRNSNDIPVTLTELGATPLTVTPADPNQFATDRSTVDNATYYYTPRGFVGEVVQKDGVVYVVFRGTDSSESFFNGLKKAAANGFNQTATDPSRLSDLGDWTNNVLLALGTSQETQLDDALALTRAAEAAAGGGPVVVVGQSLGGGLAGLVAAIENLPGYAIAPAAFQNQLAVEAQEYAFSQFNFNLALIPLGVAEDFFSNTRDGQTKYLEANGYDTTTIAAFFALADQTFGQYLTNLRKNLQVYSITGEVLSDGIGFLSALVGGVQFNVPRTLAADPPRLRPSHFSLLPRSRLLARHLALKDAPCTNIAIGCHADASRRLLLLHTGARA